jgi:hypothetical protein
MIIAIPLLKLELRRSAIIFRVMNMEWKINDNFLSTLEMRESRKKMN